MAKPGWFALSDFKKLREDVKSLREEIKGDIAKLDNNRREDFRILASKMDQLLLHMTGIQPPPNGMSN